MGSNERFGLVAPHHLVPLDNKWLELIDEEWVRDLDWSPFLMRCRAGLVTREELNSFLIQQNYYSRHFTRYLCALLSNMNNETDRLELTENLLEEIGFGDEGE